MLDAFPLLLPLPCQTKFLNGLIGIYGVKRAFFSDLAWGSSAI